MPHGMDTGILQEDIQRGQEHRHTERDSTAAKLDSWPREQGTDCGTSEDAGASTANGHRHAEQQQRAFGTTVADERERQTEPIADGTEWHARAHERQEPR